MPEFWCEVCQCYHSPGCSPKEVGAFLDAIEDVCRTHSMSISHEDGHGAFLIEEFDETNIRWLREAQIVKKGQ